MSGQWAMRVVGRDVGGVVMACMARRGRWRRSELSGYRRVENVRVVFVGI